MNLCYRNTLHRAFNEWSEASRNVLQFEETTVSNGTSNFIVLFANGPHNDSLPFDGRGRYTVSLICLCVLQISSVNNSM